MNPGDLNEALLFQRRQQELQRDLQLRQMLIQGQIDRQQNMHQQRLLEFQQQYAGQQAQQTLASLQHDEQVLKDQILRRRQLQQQIQNDRMAPLSSIGSPIQRSINAETMIADTLSANATRRSTGNRKRSTSTSNEETARQPSKRSRKDSFSKEQNDAILLAEASLLNMEDDSDLHTKPKAKKKARKSSLSPEITHEAHAIEGFQELLNAQEKEAEPVFESPEKAAAVELLYTKGTIESLLEAGKVEQEVDDAATVMVTLQDVADLSESEPDEPGIGNGDDDGGNAVAINLPGFKSKLPQLPVEPVLDVEFPVNKSLEKTSPEKTPPEMTLSQQKSNDESEDDEEDKDNSTINDEMEASATTTDQETRLDQNEQAPETKENGAHVPQVATIQPVEYPYPIDTWWPSITTIRRERRSNGEETDQENFGEELGLFNDGSLFRGDSRAIRNRLANDIQPGMLEKIPHCKIHRLKTRAQKGANIPDHAFCWQVTETYCNDIMVCCSICSTWRHAGCGGHYKPYSVREIIESQEPFEAVCDLCHEEQALIQDYPRGQARLERQRIEQLRRAFATSAVIRQAAFVKYGGTYKWPLGSVSGTHIGGHVRSVHSRHDKAEKTWSDMTSRLARDNRPKERGKTRTREFERLLICLEDAGTFK